MTYEISSMKRNKKEIIGILGGGNIGIALSIELVLRGKEIILFTNNIKKWNNEIELVEDNIVKGKCIIENIVDDIKIVCESCDTIVITYPPHMFNDTANKLIKYIRPGTKLILVPGLGGAEYVFKKIIDSGCILIGLQRVPAVYRLVDQNKRATINGRRKEGLHISSIPKMKETELRTVVEDLFKMKCTALPNYLNITLTPSNPILHTTRLYSLFHRYPTNYGFIDNPNFYGDWDDESSELLLACDDELRTIINKLSKINLSKISSLKEHYESESKEQLTKKISSIESLNKIKTPMIEENGIYRIDWNSRYFLSDFSNGLVIIKSIGIMTCVDTPNIDKVLEWYQKSINKKYIANNNFKEDICECNIPQNYGILDIEQFIKYYS